MRSLFFISILFGMYCNASAQCRLVPFDDVERAALVNNRISAVRIYKVSDTVKALVKKALIDEQGCSYLVKENFYQNSYNIWNATENSRNKNSTQRKFVRSRDENGRSVITEEETENYTLTGKMISRTRKYFTMQTTITVQQFDTLDADRLDQWTTVLDSISNDTLKRSAIHKTKDKAEAMQNIYENGVVTENQRQITLFEFGKWKEILTYKNGELVNHKKADQTKNGKPKPGDGTLLPKPIPRYGEGKKDTLYTDKPEKINFATSRKDLRSKKTDHTVIITYQYNDDSIIEKLEVLDSKKGLPVKKLYPSMKQLFLYEYDRRN